MSLSADKMRARLGAWVERVAGRFATSLSLSSKVWLLVLMLLLCEVVFVVSLSAMIKAADNELRQIDEARVCVVKTDSIPGDIFSAGQLLRLYDGSRNPVVLKAFEGRLERARSSLVEVRPFFSKAPDQRKTFSEYEHLCNHILALLEESAAIIQGGSGEFPFIDNHAAIGELTSYGTATIKYHEELLSEARKIDSNSPVRKGQLRAVVTNTLLGGLVVSACVALILASIFNWSTSRRLQVLMDNTARLTDQQPLQELVGGSDEIGRLDATFHQLASALREADQAKQRFVAMISHDLRTPLASIRAGLEIMSVGIGATLQPQGQENVSACLRNADRMIKLIDELLEVERLESGSLPIECESIDVADVVTKSLDAVSTIAEQSKVELVAVLTCSMVSGDAHRLTQVLVNLVSNALKFAPAHSAITVTCEPSGQGWIDVSIADRGPGIPAAEQEYIFDRFKQAGTASAARSKGFGLGLSICKSIIEQHGGEIGVRSAVGVGSTFWFRLPASNADGAGSA